MSKAIPFEELEKKPAILFKCGETDKSYIAVANVGGIDVTIACVPLALATPAVRKAVDNVVVAMGDALVQINGGSTVKVEFDQ